MISFARPRDVREMRLLLLQYGARESDRDKKLWEDRERYDLYESAWLANFHRDDREG